jgi:hypothetical protein
MTRVFLVIERRTELFVLPGGRRDAAGAQVHATANVPRSAGMIYFASFFFIRYLCIAFHRFPPDVGRHDDAVVHARHFRSWMCRSADRTPMMKTTSKSSPDKKLIETSARFSCPVGGSVLERAVILRTTAGHTDCAFRQPRRRLLFSPSAGQENIKFFTSAHFRW